MGELEDRIALSLGRRLRESGMLQEELAERAGVTQSTISRLMKAQTDDPKLSTIWGLAQALGVTIDSFVAPDDEDAQASKAVSPLFTAAQAKRLPALAAQVVDLRDHLDAQMATATSHFEGKFRDVGRELCELRKALRDQILLTEILVKASPTRQKAAKASLPTAGRTRRQPKDP